MWVIWQDGPDYGCEDHPSFKWYARREEDGHVLGIIGPYETREDVKAATGENEG